MSELAAIINVVESRKKPPYSYGFYGVSIIYYTLQKYRVLFFYLLFNRAIKSFFPPAISKVSSFLIKKEGSSF